MLGFYDYTVVMTYISLSVSMLGMMAAVGGRFRTAIFCLAVSGLCDMFDGKIARTKKNRTAEEKRFGIQIDSLCDVVCFGVFPILICYQIGVRSWHGRAVLVLFGVASVIRLAYFNVMEEKRQDSTEEARKCYQGLPITSSSVVLPLTYLLRPCLKGSFYCFLEGTMALTGLLFVCNFEIKKPGNKMLAVLVAVVALAVWKVLHTI
ncbi:MAG TPA: CDP-diacylglycerol--serine O-phosphatidyltransferase [Lachnospiraceae bacterium]|nr:CDP-diacylglycerol--serine O-phosphatidyltransferase [Lachnospiraceae bacterium]